REQIIDHLGNNQIGRLCFMTGDMHCSYHMQMTITPAGGPPVTIHELMSSPINQVPSGSHAIIANPLPATTVTNVTYQTAPLDLAEFYGEHSNVMLVKYARASRRASWAIYRTKRDLPPPLTGSFVL
ncbi:MAG TPA: hypothetical protein VFS78_15090, partial [Vicinamibacteria bacterium]|nr:hypothetical protein [Vicinamibacteria bacterium]